ncbi:MAG TPA: EAL domain-containing protein, partial [Steroidobacteraceae bacterium]|nr:EAL domain-containing protein [Steroidobacteraceae bacterium]
PRASSVNIYDERGELLWATHLSMSLELTTLVQESIADAIENPSVTGRFKQMGEVPVYLFWLRREDPANGPPLASLVVRLKAGGNIESCSFGFVQQIVQPALDVLRQDLLAREEIQRLRDSMQEQTQELKVLEVVAGRGTETGQPGAEDLKSILANSAKHMKVGMAALIVPDKGLAMTVAGDGGKLDYRLLAKAHRHLVSVARMRREPLMINKVSLPGQEQSEYRILAAPVFRPDGHAIGVFALFRTSSSPEFTASHSRVIELLARRLASVVAYEYDELSGLLTRQAFERRMKQILQDPKRAQSEWTALYIDIDHMHAINDAHGMHNGDRILKQLGELIRRHIPPGALATRVSADRFAILLPARLDDSVKVGEALCQNAPQLSASLGVDKVSVSVSVGVARVESMEQDFTHVLAHAETACKAAKARGANRVESYQEDNESIVRRMTELRLVANLQRALAENTLQLFAQLIAPLGDRQRPPQFELLLRLIDEKGKRVGPDQFMSAAQRHELMPAIDRWVIQTTLESLKPHASLLAQDLVGFSVNVSGHALRDASFAEDIESVIRASGLAPGGLCFEISEDAMMGNLAPAENFMRRLSKLGCRIALDDFGTGLSALAYLRTLPIGTLKIAGSFVRDVLVDSKADSMVASIAHLAHSMGLTTVAKQVETEEVCTRVASLGADYAQGFSIASPVPLREILSELPLYTTPAKPYLAVQMASGKIGNA